ncbi:Oidioi.mRNA.OKI2018_I69.chr1.g2669.t1.cds [Oikopleura dioica]|uniref:Oidioi.mRNA.OKI2018_I69.chr1.g2669.t1.cds n=1 Tax=Oikopleura dioica TaxID=34765 RepID=A0ABN7SVP5_OIKDI|nr:Oidioi.mRNA.OKI2018_I69.chr1.g2669.t1.cds [Oikopleura dioica]
MKAYNRRWFILAALLALAGIACICTCLGYEEVYKMDIKRGNSSDDIGTRTIGLMSGSDKYRQKTWIHWPIKCDLSMCTESDPDALYPMLCSCTGNTSIDFIINSSLWWANLSMIILGLVCAVYAFVVSAYNAATKPTVEYLSTRAVAGSFTAAIIFEVTAMALTLTLYFTAIQYEDPSYESTCILPEFGGISSFWASFAQGYVCENEQLGLSFYMIVISIALFLISLWCSFMAQRGFQSLDHEAEFVAETGDKKEDIMMF